MYIYIYIRNIAPSSATRVMRPNRRWFRNLEVRARKASSSSVGSVSAVSGHSEVRGGER